MYSGGMVMTKDEYWDKFSKTGNVLDYLDYAKAKVQRDSNVFREDTSNTYAGFNQCDGDDSKVRTDR